ncbi:MAG: DUF4160 domain-containing protein [Planctomycetia bacterium]
MPKVRCFEIAGLYCWFWSDDHDPPHFHVKRRGEWELRVKFLEDVDEMFQLKWGDQPKAKVLKEIAGLVMANRGALLLEWEEKGSE